MFPDFQDNWIIKHHVWRAFYSQPVVECHYSELIPEVESPIPNLLIATMAQIYPEDRGTNYAIRQGRQIGCRVAGLFG
jgi:protoporphyrinogen oxidase